MSRPRGALRNRLEYGLYLGVRFVAGVVGPRVLWLLGGAVGALYLRIGRRRREILEFNIELAYPELGEDARRRLAVDVARHFGREALDTLRLQRMTPEGLLDEVSIEGREHLERALAEDAGVFVLSAHLGAWEVTALTIGLLIPEGFALVARPLDNPLLEGELERFRSRFGNTVLGKHGIARRVLEQLKRGGGVGIIMDQRTLQEEGVRVPFFGRPSWTNPGPARLALRTGAPIVPVWSVREGPGRVRVWFDEPLLPGELAEDEREVTALTARLMAMIEDVVRRYPEQWLWYHDRWRDLRRAAGSDAD